MIKTQIWQERDEGHMVIVQMTAGVVIAAALIGPGDDLDALCETGMPEGANDADLAEMIDASQDEFNFVAEVRCD